jgi:hypothetical protein
LLLGLAFTTSYRLVVPIAVIVAFDLVWTVVVGSWPASFLRAARRALGWVVGLLVAPALWQAVDTLAAHQGTALFRSEQTTQPERYVDQAMQQLHAAGYATLAVNPLTLQWYVGLQGWLMLALLLVGLGAVLWIRSFPWLLTAALVVVPFVAAMSAPYVVARTLDAAIPFASLLIAAALIRLAAWRSWLRPVGAAVVIVAVVIEAVLSWQLTGERSGFARAAAYVDRHDDGRALTSSEVMLFYLRGSGLFCDAPRVPNNLGHLAADIRAGYRYAVVDYHIHGYVSRIVRHHAQLAAQYQTAGLSGVDEELIESEDANRPPNPIAARYVDVYRLDVMHLPVSPTAKVDVCRRDRTG